MFAVMGLQAASSLETASAQAGALQAKGIYDQSVADTNAKIATLESTQTLEAGDIAASRKRMETDQAAGEMRATQGASGTAVGSGSNALTRIGANLVGTADELTIRNNAARQAWGYKTQAISDTYQGRFAKLTAESQAKQTLLTGGLQAISGPLSTYGSYARWSAYRGMGGTPGAPFPSGNGGGSGGGGGGSSDSVYAGFA